MKRSRVLWITSSSFYDVDKDLVRALAGRFEICWIVVRFDYSFYSTDDILRYIAGIGVDGTVVDSPRLMSAGAFKCHQRLAREIGKGEFDTCYIDYPGMPWLVPMLGMYNVDRSRIVFSCHDFREHSDAPNRLFTTLYKRLLFSCFRNIQFYSLTEQARYAARYRNSSHCIPMLPKDFGNSGCEYSRGDKVRFLFFGRDERRKGLSVAVEAADMLWSSHPDKFVMKIASSCRHSERCLEKIENAKAFEIIRRDVSNDEIPALFGSADILVLPYLEVTQSGPMFIAFRYGVPMIASDLPGFREFIHEKADGLLFKTSDAKSLANAMAYVIDNPDIISEMRGNQADYVSRELSIKAIADRYANMFNNPMTD